MADNMPTWFHVMLRVFLILTISLTLIDHSEAHGSSGVTFELPDNEKMCFYEDFEGSRRYILDYQVLSGGNNDVDVKIESPNGKLVYQEFKKRNDRVTFEISWGTYTFCFSNEFSSVTHKVVYFEVRPEDEKPLAMEGGKKAPTVNTQMEEYMETIHSHSTRVMGYQKSYRLNEARGRYKAEELNLRVQWWSLIQSVVILFAGIGEIFILKRFFTDRKHESAVSPLLAGLKQPEVLHAPIQRP